MTVRSPRILLIPMVLGLAASIGAAVLPGKARAACLVAFLACATALAVLPSRLPLGPGPVLGGAGYQVPKSGRIRLVHVLVTLLYNLGLMVLVLSALIRFGLVEATLATGPVTYFPLLMGAYLVLLGFATQWRIEERGAVVRDWYTKAHGAAVLTVSAAVALIGLLLLWREPIGSPPFDVRIDDLQALVLAGLLGAGTQLFLTVELPTVFQIAASFMHLMSRDARKERASQGTPPFVYAVFLTLGIVSVVGWGLWRADIVDRLGNFRNERVALLLLLFPLGIGVFVGVSAFQIWRESRRGIYRRRLSTKLRNDLFFYGMSGILGGASSVLLALSLAGRLDHVGPFPTGPNTPKDLIMLTVVLTSAPIGWYLHRQNRAVDNIESRLPDFLNDLAETRRAGLTLTASLQSAATADYGALSPEIRKMADQVSWGVPFTDALAQFAERVRTSLVRRSVYLIIEASKTGGSVADILKAAAKDAYEIKGLESDRRTTMLTYLIVLYVVFFVFMTVIAVLDGQFIPQVLAANAQVQETRGGASGVGPFSGKLDIDPEAIAFVYYNAAMVQSIGNGIVAGVLSEGRISAGLRHVALMAFSAWLVFRFILAV